MRMFAKICIIKGVFDDNFSEFIQLANLMLLTRNIEKGKLINSPLFEHYFFSLYLDGLLFIKVK